MSRPLSTSSPRIASYPIISTRSGKAKNSVVRDNSGIFTGVTKVLIDWLDVSMSSLAVLISMFAGLDKCFRASAVLLKLAMNEAVAPVSSIATVVWSPIKNCPVMRLLCDPIHATK